MSLVENFFAMISRGAGAIELRVYLRAEFRKKS
jgi:hypothetical protein